jgi:hypothetical protein
MDVVLQAVRDFEAVEKEAEGCDLIEEDLGGNAEAAVDGVVVEDEGIGAVVDCGGAGGAAEGGCISAVWCQQSAYLDVVGIVVIDAAADDEIAGKEVDAAVVIVILRDSWNGGEGGD